MGAVDIAGMLAIEASAMANGWTEEQLLNLAGARLGHAIARFFPVPGTIIGYLGKGHNAGDALVALRVLRDEFGWKIATRHAFPISGWTPLAAAKWDELDCKLPLDRMPDWRDIRGPLVLLDGLVGSGTSGPLGEPLAILAAEMNALREQAGARIAAVDIPSGIDPDSGKSSTGAVTADITFMIAKAKTGLLAGHAASATGALALVHVDPLSANTTGPVELIAPQALHFGKEPRSFDFHKGTAGRVAILAGSDSYQGAAVMATTGALRGGAGLVTLFVPESTRQAVAIRCLPEVIVRGFTNPREILENRFDVLVTGCGLGELDQATTEGLLDLITASPAPVVIDADALNLLAKHGKTGILTSRHIITPHPGEFKRLAPDLAALPREQAARAFADRVPAILLLKGSRTIVTARDKPLRCNSTGTPGMASGGQGDLLAGVIGALLAGGMDPLDAASLGAWTCGRAAEIALSSGTLSEESLLATDVAARLGPAFLHWKRATR